MDAYNDMNMRLSQKVVQKGLLYDHYNTTEQIKL